MENRKIEIRDPGQYFGQLGQQQSSEQVGAHIVFAVNGEIDKCDANFEGEFFIKTFAGLAFGNYPILSRDYKKIEEEKVTRILNISGEKIECCLFSC